MSEHHPGLAGVGAKAHWHAPVSGKTKSLNITGPLLLVTADTDTLYGGGENPEGSKTLDNVGKLTVSVLVEGISNPLNCKSLVGKNVTDTALEGCSLTEHIGKRAKIQIVAAINTQDHMYGLTTNGGWVRLWVRRTRHGEYTGARFVNIIVENNDGPPRCRDCGAINPTISCPSCSTVYCSDKCCKGHLCCWYDHPGVKDARLRLETTEEMERLFLREQIVRPRHG